MAESATLEQPPKAAPEYIPPQGQPEKPLKVKAGDVWKTEFAKLTKAEAEGKPEEKPAETPPLPKEEPKPEVKPEVKPEDAPTEIIKPTSPLDVVTADKKPEEKVEVEDDDDGFDENRTDWKRANELRKAQKREIKELKAKVQENEKVPRPDPEEITRLTQERDTLKQSLAEREELIKTVDVRLSEDYQKVARKVTDTVQKIASRAKSYGADPDTLISALQLPDGRFKNEQIKMAMSEVDPDDRGRINALIETLDTHNEALAEFERDAPKKYEEIQAKRDAQLREQQEQSVKAIQTEFVKLSETLPTDIVTLREVPDDVPGGTEWNQAIKTARETALRVLNPGGSDFNETGAIAIKGAHYDALMNMFLKDHSELVDARKRLTEYDSGGADFKGGTGPKTEPKLSPSQKFHKALETIKADPTE